MNLLNNLFIYLIPFKLKIRDECYIIKGEIAWMVESASMCEVCVDRPKMGKRPSFISNYLWLIVSSQLGPPPSATPLIYCENICSTYWCANPCVMSLSNEAWYGYWFPFTHGALQVPTINQHLADVLTMSFSKLNSHFSGEWKINNEKIIFL